MFSARPIAFAMASIPGITAIAMAQNRITGIGQLPGLQQSSISGLSADGQTAVGTASQSTTFVAVRWTARDGIQSIGVSPTGANSYGRSISANGKWIAGTLAAPGQFTTAYRWSEATGVQSLPTFPKGRGAAAFGISADGSTVVGRADDDLFQTWPVRWSEGVLQTLVPWTPFDLSPVAIDLSADGGTIIGNSDDRAVRWQEVGAPPEGIASALGAQFTGVAGISASGDVIVGNAEMPTGTRAFVWTRQSGVSLLPAFPGAIRTYVHSVSGDGLTIGGQAWVNGGIHATIGTPASGFISVAVLLESLGAFLHGWNLQDTAAISANGLVIAGTGRYFDTAQGWVAYIGPLPCYANCDGSTTPPHLNVADLACFLTSFSNGLPYANCDASTAPPVLNVNDFACFLNAYAGECR